MRIGVVCEGPTDFLAISTFLAHSLINRGVDADFVDVQPELDVTSANSGGGWANALSWLQANPLAARRSAYLGPGLFGGSLAAKRCDYLLIQIDSDVLDDVGFKNYVSSRIIHALAATLKPAERYLEAQLILLEFSGFKDITEALSERHFISPVVENSETWCAAARAPDIFNIEALDKVSIASELNIRLSAFEAGTPRAGTLKNVMRRKGYCDGHAAEFERVEAFCPHYLVLVEMIANA